MYMARSLDQNIHVLLPRSDLQLLKDRAQREKKSVGELIRLAVRKCHGTFEPEAKLKAFQKLSQHSELTMQDWDDVKKDLLHRYE